MAELTLDWSRLYREYMPEIISITVSNYEEQRNRDMHGFTPPEGTPRYTVDRDRYDDAFWEELVWACFAGGGSPDTLYDRIDFVTHGKGPWPDLLRSTAVRMSTGAPIDGLPPTGGDRLDFDPLHLGSENGIQKQINAHEKLNFVHLGSFGAGARLCVYLSRPEFADHLYDNRAARFLFGEVLYRALNRGDRGRLEGVVKTLLCVFIVTKLSKATT